MTRTYLLIPCALTAWALVAAVRGDCCLASAVRRAALPQAEGPRNEGEDLRGKRLEELEEQVERRRALLRQVASLLIERRITLVEAAGRLRPLHSFLADGGRGYLKKYPGRSEGERLCRWVIFRVPVELEKEGRSAQAAELRQRLQEELGEMLRCDPVVMVPEECLE
jgi:hypothetical protein